MKDLVRSARVLQHAPSEEKQKGSDRVGCRHAIAHRGDHGVRWSSPTENIEHLRGQIRLIECDLRDAASVHRLLLASAPTAS